MPQSRALHRYDWAETIEELVVHETAAERRRRLNQRAKDGKKAREIDRTGNIVHLERAAKRLKHMTAENRVLIVPHWDMDKAEEAMRRAGVSGSVSNITGSHFRRIKHARD